MLSRIVTTVLFAGFLFLSTVHAQRITVQGNKFFVGENPIFMLGANTPWDKWNDFGNTFNATWWSTHFQSLHSYGINCTRIWISCDGANASPGISSSGVIAAPTPTFWDHLTTLFQIAQDNKIYLMLAPISFDHTKTGNKNADSWRAMYASAANRQTFVDNYILPLVKKYGDSPYFWAIDVGNELDWVFENHGVDTNNVFDLAARVAVGVHANSKVLVTLGTGAGPKYLSPSYGINHYADGELQKLVPGAYLDFYDDHYYPWMRQYFSSPFEKGPASWKIDEKPCVIGEYGAKGDSTIYTPAQCLQKAFDLGWLGVMPWTSNGVDGNGSVSDFGSAFKTWSDAHRALVSPPLTENPGPFTLSVTAPQGGTITVNPQSAQYNKGDKVTCIAIPDNGKALLKWTGDATGTTDSIVLTMSRDMTISASFATAGELVQNGAFDSDDAFWSLGTYEGGAATGMVTGDGYQITLTNGGTDVWHVQMLQAGLIVEANKGYALSFDASATAERSLFVAVGEAGGSYTKYFEKTVTIGTEKQHYAFEFTSAASTTNARVEFNIGNSTAGVLLDNISLRHIDAAPIHTTICGDMQQKTMVRFDAGNRVLYIQDVSGRLCVEGFSTSGRRIFAWNNTTTDGMAAISLDNISSQMIILRGMVDGIQHFSRKVMCRK